MHSLKSQGCLASVGKTHIVTSQNCSEKKAQLCFHIRGRHWEDQNQFYGLGAVVTMVDNKQEKMDDEFEWKDQA